MTKERQTLGGKHKGKLMTKSSTVSEESETVWKSGVD